MEASMDKSLDAAQQAELRFLRQRVDRLEGEMLSLDKEKDINQRLFEARNQLKGFVEGLRKQGYRI
jgi:hypothetical protein